MDNADSALKGVFLKLTSPQILTEVIAIVLAGLIALAGAHMMRTWYRNYLAKSPTARDDVWQIRVLEGTVLLAPFLVALIGMPLLNYFAPAFMATRVAGFTLTWLILGVLFFPFVWIISWRFIRRSIALENDEVNSVKR